MQQPWAGGRAIHAGRQHRKNRRKGLRSSDRPAAASMPQVRMCVGEDMAAGAQGRTWRQRAVRGSHVAACAVLCVQCACTSAVRVASKHAPCRHVHAAQQLSPTYTSCDCTAMPITAMHQCQHTCVHTPHMDALRERCAGHMPVLTSS